jgi:hypothetical protein
VGGQLHVSAALPPGKTRYPLYRRLCGSPERPAGSQSLYRLGYPAHSAVKVSTSIFILYLTEIILSVDYKEKKINVFGEIIAVMCCLSY